MRTSRKRRPELDGLESKALLSGAAGAATAIVAPPAPHVIHLNGTVKGGYVEHQSNPDLPTTYALFGDGAVGLKARTALAGELYSGGFTSHPGAHGKVFLADAHGTITVKLEADKAGGQAGGLADQYDYTIIGGTGAYKGAEGHGSAVLTLDPGKPATATAVGHGGTTTHGRFTLAFVG